MATVLLFRFFFFTIWVKCEVKLSRQQLVSFFQTSQNSQFGSSDITFSNFTVAQKMRNLYRPPDKSTKRIMQPKSNSMHRVPGFLFFSFSPEIICTWHNVIPNPGNARWIFHSAPLMGCVLNTACQRQINYELLYHKGHYCFIKEHSSVNRAMETRLGELVFKLCIYIR